MDDVQVAEGHISHVLGPTFVAQQEHAGTVAPKDAVLDRDPLDVAVGGLEIEALQRDAVIVAADETIGNQHILGIARIDAVVILHAGIAQFHVTNGNMSTAPRHDRPVR